MTNNPDLPQHSDGGTGWLEFHSAFELSQYMMGVPIAIQVMTPEKRVLVTGVVMSTYDVFPPGEDPNVDPSASYVWFKGNRDSLFIEWTRIQGALVMVAEMMTVDHEDNPT